MPLLEREAMGARGRSYYLRNFSHETLVDQLIEHLSSVFRDKEISE
jgi:hypothetical protein